MLPILAAAHGAVGGLDVLPSVGNDTSDLDSVGTQARLKGHHVLTVSGIIMQPLCSFVVMDL